MKKTNTEKTPATPPQKPKKRSASPKCDCGQCYNCLGHDMWMMSEIARLMDKDD